MWAHLAGPRRPPSGGCCEGCWICRRGGGRCPRKRAAATGCGCGCASGHPPSFHSPPACLAAACPLPSAAWSREGEGGGKGGGAERSEERSRRASNAFGVVRGVGVQCTVYSTRGMETFRPERQSTTTAKSQTKRFPFLCQTFHLYRDMYRCAVGLPTVPISLLGSYVAYVPEVGCEHSL
eukprot:1188375-Prorocentrum_minimum.AAC.2